MSRQATVQAIQPVPHFPGLATIPAWVSAGSREFDGLQISHAPMFYIPKFFKSLDGWWLYRSLRRALELLDVKRDPVIIDAHFGFPEGVGAYLVARQQNLPFFVTFRGNEAEYLDERTIGSQIRAVIQQADGVICVGHFMKNLALEHGAPFERVRVVHNGIDKRMFRPGDQIRARSTLQLPKYPRIVISVGNLITRKRHHVLIAAFAKLRATVPDALLLIVGAESFEAYYPKRLYGLAKQLGVESSVMFLGNVPADQVAQYLHAADVFALATQREGCCNAVIEALACGVPVVTTPVGDNSEFVTEEMNGFITPVDDVESMAAALHASLSRKWDKAKIANQLKVGDWSSVAGEVLDFMAERIDIRNGVSG